MEALLENNTHMRVRWVHSQGDGCTGNQVSENGNRGKEKLGGGKGQVQNWRPLERFTGKKQYKRAIAKSLRILTSLAITILNILCYYFSSDYRLSKKLLYVLIQQL